MSYAKTAELIEMLFGLWTRVGPRKQCFIGGAEPHAKGQFLLERTFPGMRDDTLSRVEQKTLHRLRCRSDCVLWWAKGSMSYMGSILAPPG